jgi:hypothetical protein
LKKHFDIETVSKERSLSGRKRPQFRPFHA